jgi:3-oxoacyl-(acyl-carrier-protein) synthase
LSTQVSVTSIASFSPLGKTPAEVWKSYLDQQTSITKIAIGSSSVPAAALGKELLQEAAALQSSDVKYRQLDNSVLFALLASRAAVHYAGWGSNDVFGINIGSSRGATQLFEQYYQEYLQSGRAAVQASPSTTLGNISSWVAHDLKSAGPDVSHSITCSTALHAVLNGVAWLRAGMANKFLVGGSEAPLTPFTISQMQAMKIYSSLDEIYPSRALDLRKKTNTMVLGEGAASACLELGRVPNALAYIEGVGYATELLHNSVSLSADAQCVQRSMAMALEGINPAEVDAVVMHAPGTIKGDLSEYGAIQQVFGNRLPLLTTNKWKIGHTLGASGLLSLEMAVLMMQHGMFIGVPFLEGSTLKEVRLEKILINAVGFGGNAVSILLAKP